MKKLKRLIIVGCALPFVIIGGIAGFLWTFAATAAVLGAHIGDVWAKLLLDEAS